jgi:rubrerythrin
MEKFSLREAIEQAVQTERLGFEFYREMAKRFSDKPQTRDLCETLARKELDHEKRFSELMGAVKDGGEEDWDEVSKYLRAIVESEFFLGKGKSLPSLAAVKTVADAVRFAIGFEKETLLYFYAIRDVLKEKDVVSGIIAEEKTHILWLSRFDLGTKQ